MQRQKITPEKEPTWSEIFGRINSNAQAKKALEEWQPTTIAPTDVGYEQEAACLRGAQYLHAWRNKNYGAMALLISQHFAEATVGKTAGMIRTEVEDYDLEEFTMGQADFVAPAVCEIDVELTLATGTSPGRMRWIRETTDRDPATPNEPGQWHLYLWSPGTILNRQPYEDEEAPNDSN
jgi:hypothetical protein